MDRRVLTGWLVVAAGCLGRQGIAADQAASQPGASQPAAVALRMEIESADHASWIYYPKEGAKVTLIAENTGGAGVSFEGAIQFGVVEKQEFKLIETIPIAAPAMLGAGERVKVPISVTMAQAGVYQFRYEHQGKVTAAQGELMCIFAPRTAGGQELGPGVEGGPWVVRLPAGEGGAAKAGFLEDYIRRTSVRQFVMDERFAFDSGENVGLGFGASLGIGEKQIDSLFGELARSGGELILRLRIPAGAKADGRTEAALRAYLEQAAKRTQGRLSAVAICPEGIPADGAGRAAFRAIYLAGREAIKGAKKDVAMLGAGSAEATALLPAEGRHEDILKYIDAMGVSDAAQDMAAGRRQVGDRAPIWLLPGAGDVNAGAAMAQGARVVALPEPAVDHGATAHLLGGASFFKMVSAGDLAEYPYIAVFQGDGFAVGMVAGFGAGTAADVRYPGLARWHAGVMGGVGKEDDKPSGPGMTIADDSQGMRVVDAAGAAVNCRTGDSVHPPLDGGFVYILQAGGADDLAGLIRTAKMDHVPMMDVTVAAAKAGGDKPVVMLRNITGAAISGRAEAARRPGEGQEPVVIGRKEFSDLAAGQSVEMACDAADGPMIVAVTAAGGRAQITVVENGK